MNALNPRQFAAPKPRRHGSGEPVRGRAVAASARRSRRSARSRARSSSDSTASARTCRVASRRRTTSARSKTSPAGCASCSSPRSFVGCTAVGVAGGCDRGRRRPRPVGVRGAASARGGSTASRSTRSRPTTAWRSRVGPTSVPARGTLLMLADPFSFPVARLSRLCNAQVPELTVDRRAARRPGRGPGGNRLVFDDRVLTSGAVAVMCSDDVPVRAVVSQGCRPIGKPLTVTRRRAQPRATSSRASPRCAVCRRSCTAATDDERELMRDGLHLGLVVDEHRLDFDRGDFLVRNVLGADQCDGVARRRRGRRRRHRPSSSRSATPRPPTKICVHLLERRRTATARCCSPATAGARTCSREPDHDASVDRGAARIRCRSSGAFCAGEIGPVGGRNFLHGFTASVAVFG